MLGPRIAVTTRVLTQFVMIEVTLIGFAAVKTYTDFIAGRAMNGVDGFLFGLSVFGMTSGIFGMLSIARADRQHVKGRN